MIFLSGYRFFIGDSDQDPSSYMSGNTVLLVLLLLFLLIPAVSAVNPEALTWTRVANSPFNGHTIGAMAEFDGKLWVISGKGNSDFYNEVWSSPDGITWTRVTQDAPFAQNSSLGLVVINNRLWVLGGDGTGEIGYTHVWNSGDGITWTQVTDQTPFRLRVCAGITVFNGRIWVIGGDTKNYPQQSTWDLAHDVWYSTDGITWTETTDGAAFSPRSNFPATSFDDKLWVIGGWNGSAVFNDVWYSTDGITWSKSTDHAAFSPRSDCAATGSDGKLWVISGATYSDYPNGKWEYNSDIWSSPDGTIWTQVTGNAPFTGRTTPHIMVFDQKIWLVGGFNGNNALSDEWYSTTEEFEHYISFHLKVHSLPSGYAYDLISRGNRAMGRNGYT